MTAFLYGPERLDDQGGDKKPPDADKATFQNCFDELQDFLASAEQQVRRVQSIGSQSRCQMPTLPVGPSSLG